MFCFFKDVLKWIERPCSEENARGQSEHWYDFDCIGPEDCGVKFEFHWCDEASFEKVVGFKTEFEQSSVLPSLSIPISLLEFEVQLIRLDTLPQDCKCLLKLLFVRKNRLHKLQRKSFCGLTNTESICDKSIFSDNEAQVCLQISTFRSLISPSATDKSCTAAKSIMITYCTICRHTTANAKTGPKNKLKKTKQINKPEEIAKWTKMIQISRFATKNYI